jgi:hypothetical protein
MPKIKIMASGVAAVLAVGCMLAATVAQATLPTPEWQVKGSKLTKNIPFEVKGTVGEFKVGSLTLTWTSAWGEGQVEAPNKIANFFLKFGGAKIGSCEVHSPGGKAGEVNTKQLKGRLGYVNEKAPLVGVLIESAEGSAGTIVEVEKSSCDPSSMVLSGGTIGEYTPINAPRSLFEASFSVSNKIVKFEGEAAEHILHLNGSSGTTVLFGCVEAISIKEGVEVEIKT